MKNYILSDSKNLEQEITGLIFLENDSNLIGSYEMFAKDDRFLAAINVYPDYQGLGIGFYAFKHCYDELSKANNLKVFNASWSKHSEYSHLPNSSSINLTVFLNEIDSGVDKETALWKTPTGKWMKKLGFIYGQICDMNKEQVNVVFTKRKIENER
jgi:hypothetical protein